MIKTQLTFTGAALVLVGFLGACGSDDGSEGGSGSGSGESAEGGQDGQELYDWVDCMAGEGIELPEPPKDADGNLVVVGDGVDLAAEAGRESSFGEYSEDEFQAGTDICGGPPIHSGWSDETRQEQSEATLAFSECMRENGVEDFPDPEESLVEEETPDGGQMITPFDPEKTQEAQSDPDFEAADETCRDVMFPDGAEAEASDEPESGEGSE